MRTPPHYTGIGMCLHLHIIDGAHESEGRAIVITASESGSDAKIENGWRTRVADLRIEPAIGQP